MTAATPRLFRNTAFSFPTVADMQASVSLRVGDLATTAGYTTAGDGGGNTYLIVAAATGTDDGGSYIDLTGTSLQAAGQFPGRANPYQFGATGDGVTDDTDAYDAFVAWVGLKEVLPGRYLENGVVRRFDQGALGNGVFNDSESGGPYEWGYWDQVWGDRNRDSIFVNSDTVNGSTTLTSPVVKLQRKVLYNNSNPAAAFNFTRVAGIYQELVGEGDYQWLVDGATGNFTAMAATVHNKFAGQMGMTAVTGRAWDALETEVPNIATYGSSKSVGGYFPFTRRSKFENGGYMIGMEVYAQNTAAETLDIPYYNSDSFVFEEGGGFTAAIHLTALGGTGDGTGGTRKGAPITAGLLLDGFTSANHGFWNGIVVGSSCMQIDGQWGVDGTVGLTFASWSGTRYGDIAVKYGKANRHNYYTQGNKTRASLTRLMYESGPCGLSVEAGAGDNPYIHLKAGVTSAADGGSPSTYGQIDSNASWTRLMSNSGEAHIAAGGGSYTYIFNSVRFAPSTALDGLQQCGGPSQRFDNVYATNSSIVTSDERAKQDIVEIDDDVLDAWGDVGWAGFRFKDAVDLKGPGARIHFGTIAQVIKEKFEAHSLDPFAYGLLCYDEWEEQEEITETQEVELSPAEYELILVSEAVYDDFVHPETGAREKRLVKDAVYETGDLIKEAVIETRTFVVQEARAAGNRYGVRYEEALSLEAAFQRRRATRLEDALEALTARVEALEAA